MNEEEIERLLFIKVKYDLEQLKKKENILFGYQKCRGVGQRCRFLFHYLGIKYEQILFADKSDQNSWNYLRGTMFQENPTAALPFLIDKEKIICEAQAIMLYVIYKHKKDNKLLPANKQQEITTALAYTIFRQIFGRYQYTVYSQVKLQQTKPETIKFLKIQLGRLKLVLGSNQWMAGSHMTYYDIIIGQGLQQVFKFQPKLAQQFPTLLDYQKRVWNLEGIKQYVQSQEFKQYTINYAPNARWNQ